MDDSLMAHDPYRLAVHFSGGSTSTCALLIFCPPDSIEKIVDPSAQLDAQEGLIPVLYLPRGVYIVARGAGGGP